ncbi:MAG TPA: hypothetical protein VN462_08245 [Negativicutes bacterium]|nr:hypothetical protein [Negativicutes bacterium]
MDSGHDGRHTPTKTAKIMGLFMAAVLAAGAGGCGSGHVHVDRNRDGYCDEDGQPLNSNSSSGSSWYHWSHYRGGSYPAAGSTDTHATGSGISSGAKGGIGSHASGGGG